MTDEQNKCRFAEPPVLMPRLLHCFRVHDIESANPLPLTDVELEQDPSQLLSSSLCDPGPFSLLSHSFTLSSLVIHASSSTNDLPRYLAPGSLALLVWVPQHLSFLWRTAATL